MLNAPNFLYLQLSYLPLHQEGSVCVFLKPELFNLTLATYVPRNIQVL